LQLLRYFLKRSQLDTVQPILNGTFTTPKCLSENALHLIRDSLSKGVVLYLVRSGGWRAEKFLRKSQPKLGRIWERSTVEDLTLRFSAVSLELLIWLTANRLSEKATNFTFEVSGSTPADQLLAFLIYEGMIPDQENTHTARKLSFFAQNPLCRLFYPEHFQGAQAPELPDFKPWLSGLGAVILEAMQPLLCERWLFLERSKGQIGDWNLMRDRGHAEGAVLTALTQAAESNQRLDLLRFILETLSRLLSREIQAAFWIGGLHGNAPARLADRLDTQRVALSLVRTTERFQAWERRARTAGYLDEDYAESKFFLAEWDRVNGNAILNTATRVLQEIEPLRG
jgi:hypothetical protein